MSSSLTATNGTTDKEWVQVYRGIAAGLGKENFNFEKCVEDGNHTVELFRESFDAFQNNDIFKGLELFGTALMDIVKAFKDCGETDIAKALEKLAVAFIKCVKGKCSHDKSKLVQLHFSNLALWNCNYYYFGNVTGQEGFQILPACLNPINPHRR